MTAGIEKDIASMSLSPASIAADFTALIKSLGSITKKDSTEAFNALKKIEEVATQSKFSSQAYLIQALPSILALIGNKHSNKEAKTLGENLVYLICDKMSVNATREVLPMLYASIVSDKNWPERTCALKTIAALGEHAPEQLGFSLPETIPAVSDSIIDVKSEVSEAAIAAMTAACDVVGNRDIEHLAAEILRSVTNPEETEELMHKLAGVRFISTVEAPALAMVGPLLIRGLASRNRATIRQSAVIIENMSKLVDDPIGAAPFMPLLLPALEFACEKCSDPEARSICERSLGQLRRLNVLVEDAKKRNQEVSVDLVKAAITKKVKSTDTNGRLLEYISHVCCSLMSMHKFDTESWKEISEQFSILELKDIDKIVTELKKECDAMTKPLVLKDDEVDDPALDLCNCTFTLAYGTKILLHNSTMKLKRGAKYGLLGGNDSGKTTLMRAIANGSVEGFPDPSDVRTVFVEADIMGELSHLSCVDYVMADERLKDLSRDDVMKVMATVGFTPEGKAKPTHPVSSLSGGWRMKLAMARAMLQKADILLLDEPTNHLDVMNVQWVKNYIKSLKDVTAIMVSHDSGFLRDSCTHILQIERLKLKQFKGNLTDFIEANPEAEAYFNIKKSVLKFHFPKPGYIEGVKSKSKALMKMSHCYYTYPINETPTLFDVSVQVSMKSRVGCVGENGAGKSTMIKLLTGEIVPQKGDVWKHSNARVAYVPQHAFHHIEHHMDKTPNEYIRWRYSSGEDRESLAKVSMKTTPEEEKLQQTPFEYKDPETAKTSKKVICEVTGNRRNAKTGKDFEYECRFTGDSKMGEGVYLGTKTMIKQGWEKACKAIDARVAQLSGMYKRTLSSAEVEKHLAEVGLEAEFATHYRMQALSGGQKVKVVMGAALWNQPHILILDEPTNYLDRESLGALASAVEEFEGGVVIISHHNEFVSTICTEEWIMEAGHLTTKGESGAWMDTKNDNIEEQAAIETMTDARGNIDKVKQKKKMTRREENMLIKKLRKKIADDVELDDEEYEFAVEKKLYD